MTNRMFWGASILLLPFIIDIGTFDDFRLPKAKAMVLLSFIWAGFYFWKEIDKALGMGIILVGISAHFSRTMYHVEDILLFGSAILVGTFAKNATRGDVRGFFKLLETAALICATYGLIQVSGLDPWMKLVPGTTEWRPVALFGQHTLYGPFAVAGLMCSLFLGRKWRAAYLLLPVILIDSSFTYLSLIVGLFVFLWFKLGKKASVVTAGVLTVLALAVFFVKYNKGDHTSWEPINDKGRFKIWRHAAQLGFIHPISGYGFGSFKVAYPLFQDKNLREANGIKDEDLSPESRKFIEEAEYIRRESGYFFTVHNEYIQAFMEMGFPGVFCILAIITSFFWSFYWAPRSPETWGLAALFSIFLANASGNFIFHLVPQALIPLWSFIAMKTYKEEMWEVYERP